MSGICAAIHLEGGAPPSDALAPMVEAARYRGRDGVRARSGSTWWAAHLALHVTPEDALDDQPASRGKRWLVADARVDNGRELSRLLGLTGTAAEVTAPDLLHAAFARWGASCVDHLVGDYAFVVWDEGSGEVFAARDPSGVRSLHYRLDGATLVFATEVGQLLAMPGFSPGFFEPAIAGHLAGGFERPEWTFYEGVSRLPPGHLLTGDASGVRTRRFWDPDAERPLRYRREGRYAAHFRELVEEAVRCRTRSPRPVGVLLSGGVDSGTVTSVAAHLREADEALCPEVRTYSFAFDDLPDSDERTISDAIVEAYGLTGVSVPGDGAWPLAGYPEHGPGRESPFAWVYQAMVDRSVARAARDGVGVVLTGEGGDELLGDEVFDLAALARGGRLLALSREVRAMAERHGRTPRRVVRTEVVRPIRAWLSRMPGAGWVAPAARTTSIRTRAAVVTDELARRTGIDQVIAEAPRGDWFDMGPLARRRLRVTDSHLPRILAWQEHLHARHGVAAAMPLADSRLVRFVLSVPPGVVNTPSEPKRLARRAVRGIMPESARTGARKVEPLGFYRRGMLDRSVHVVKDLAGGRELVARGYAEPAALDTALQAHLNGTPSYDLWWALTLEWWLRMYGDS